MRMLIASGGSDHSQMALAFGGALARQTDGHVTVVCVCEASAEHVCEAVFDGLAPYVSELTDPRTKIRLGQPAEEILRETEENDYDLVVLGEKGHHTPMTRFLLGPVAERVANRARVPVLVVKGDPQAEIRTDIARMLVCVSVHDRDRTLRLLHAVTPLATATDAEVTVLHVMARDEEGEGTAEEIDFDTGYLAEARIPVRALVRRGPVVDEVLAESEDGDYDVVVIGGHESGDWLHNLLLENVALDILHRSRRPVLTVHG